MAEKIVNMEVEQRQEGPLLVFIDEKGNRMGFPAQGIDSIFARAKQLHHASAAQALRKIPTGQWMPAIMVTPQTWNTGVNDNGSVVILVDRGLPTEQSLALIPDHARELGNQLIETAQRVQSAPAPSRN